MRTSRAVRKQDKTPVRTLQDQIANRFSKSDKIRIFISYESADTSVAETLRTELLSFDLRNIVVFHDASNLRSGVDWQQVLTHQLTMADWLIAVHTGRRKDVFSFPGWEVGAFTAFHSEKAEKLIFCLYDTPEAPEMFKRYQNRKINTSDTNELSDEGIKKTNLYKFLTEFEQLCRSRFGDPDITHEIENNKLWELRKLTAAKSILASFIDAHMSDVERDYFPQRRLFIEVAQGDFFSKEPRKIPDDAIVRPEANAFTIIGVPASYSGNSLDRQIKPYSWGELEKLINSRSAASWMDQVNEIVISTLRNNGAGDQLHISFMAPDGNVYRSILSRHQLLRSGARRFYVDFIQAYPRKFPGDELSSQLLIGLVFASRFRFMFFETGPNSYYRSLHTAPLDELPVLVKQLAKDLDRLPLEAAEFGLTDMQKLISILGEQNQALAESFFEVWKEQRMKLGAAIDHFLRAKSDAARQKFVDALDEFSEQLAVPNRDFIRIVLSRYQAVLGIN